MATTELRPLSLGELLDRTYSYYREHFWLFVGIMAIPQLFLLAVRLLSAAHPVEYVAYLIAYTAALGATTYALSDVHLGHAATIRSAYRRMRGRIWPLVKLAVSMTLRVVSALLVLVGLVLAASRIAGADLEGVYYVAYSVAFFSVMFWMAIRYCLAIPVLLLENTTTGSEALRRSVSLTRGYRGRIFLMVVLVATVSVVAAIILQMPFLLAGFVMSLRSGQPFGLLVISGMKVAHSATEALGSPLLMIGLALAYYDTRVRKEGFDLQLMMASLDQTGQPVTPTVAVPPATS